MGEEQTQTGVLVSVNLAQVRQVPLGDLVRDTGIWKLPVDGRVPVNETGLEGDTQADLNVHGGAMKAVYVYAQEDYTWWEEQLGKPVGPGSFGENLTLSGVSVTGALIGERWRIGTAELVVTQPRQPCWKLGVKMEDRKFPNRFSEANRPGAYLAVIEDGELGVGDAVQIVDRPAHPITIGLLAYLIYNDHRLASRLVARLDEDLTPDEWREIMKAEIGSERTI